MKTLMIIILICINLQGCSLVAAYGIYEASHAYQCTQNKNLCN